MKNRRKTTSDIKREQTPLKESAKRKPLETQAYATLWKFFFVFFISSVFAGVIFRLIYTVIFEEYPDRKKIATFSQLRIINKYMLIWPVIFGIAAKLLTKDNRDSNSSKNFTKIFRLNVVVQIVMIYFCFYLIYYTTEFIKALYNEEVMSGHIYTGLLSASSFLSTTIFTHHFRSRSNNIYKVFEII